MDEEKHYRGYKENLKLAEPIVQTVREYGKANVVVRRRLSLNFSQNRYADVCFEEGTRAVLDCSPLGNDYLLMASGITIGLSQDEVGAYLALDTDLQGD
jgi:hypothetical protein